MSRNKMLKSVRLICMLMIPAFIVGLYGCDSGGPGSGSGQTKFHVTSVSYGAPAGWSLLPPNSLKITLTFNKAADETTFLLPGAVKVDLEALTSGNKAYNIAGTFKWQGDYKTAVFVSDKSLADLVGPNATENMKYTITLVGGFNHIRDATGEALVGNQPGGGGLFIHEAEVIG
jgi:hypothetical protein